MTSTADCFRHIRGDLAGDEAHHEPITALLGTIALGAGTVEFETKFGRNALAEVVKTRFERKSGPIEALLRITYARGRAAHTSQCERPNPLIEDAAGYLMSRPLLGRFHRGVHPKKRGGTNDAEL
ncbi:MAG: hypothetical protein AAF715_11945 [Myxococcota bacterium]